MGRSSKKGPYVDDKLFIKVNKKTESGSREPIKTWARRCTIVPEFVGFTFLVHNGKMFHKVFVTEDMVGQAGRVFAHEDVQRAFEQENQGVSRASKAWSQRRITDYEI